MSFTLASFYGILSREMMRNSTELFFEKSSSTVTFHVMRMIAKCKLVIANCQWNGVSISRLAGQDVPRADLWQSVASGRVAAALPICNLQ